MADTDDHVVLLGTKGGAPIRKGSRSPSSSLIQMNGKMMVIDAGLGVTRGAVEAGVTLAKLDTIIITHLHCDHVLELGPLIYTAWTSGLKTPLNLYGPPGIADYWTNFIAAMSFDHNIRLSSDGRGALSDLIHIHEYTSGLVATIDDITITAFRVEHPPVTDCFALRFDHSDRSVVFSADTCYFPPLAEFAEGADLLIHEAMLEIGVDIIAARVPNAPGLRGHLLRSHTMAQDVGRIAAAAGVKRLALNHLIPSDEPDITEADWQAAIATEWDGPVMVGHDGLRIPIGG